jgi:hypothetical protein
MYQFQLVCTATSQLVWHNVWFCISLHMSTKSSILRGNLDCSVSSLVILCSCILKGTLHRGQQLLHKNRNWQLDIQCFGWDFALKQENDLYISWVRQNVTAEVFLSVAGFFYFIYFMFCCNFSVAGFSFNQTQDLLFVIVEFKFKL